MDNDGNALVTGALYYRTTAPIGMKVWDGSQWLEASAAQQASMVTFEYVATAGQTTFTGNDANGVALSYIAGGVIVTHNGLRLRPGDDYTATNGTSIVLAVAAAAGDELVVDAFRTFEVANTYTQAQVDAALAGKQNSLGFTPVNKAGDTMTGPLSIGRAAVADEWQLQLTNSVNSGSGFWKRSNNTYELVLRDENNSAGYFTHQNGTLQTVLGGAVRHAIDASGRVLMPSQPRFRAANASSYSAAPGTLVFTSNLHNPQGLYNTSNGRFTAPVSGIYQFNVIVRVDSLPNFGQYWRIRPHRNGAHMEWVIGDGIHSQAEQGLPYSSMTMSWMIDLSAGDYIEIKMDNANGLSMSISNSAWSGYLIG